MWSGKKQILRSLQRDSSSAVLMQQKYIWHVVRKFLVFSIWSKELLYIYYIYYIYYIDTRPYSTPSCTVFARVCVFDL